MAQVLMLAFPEEELNIPAPDGFFIRPCDPDWRVDAPGWIHACEKLYDRVYTLDEFREEMIDDPECGPERIFFICRKSDGAVAGTATAKLGEVAILHNVGMAVEFMGMRLSRALCAAPVDYMFRHGAHRIQLSSDDFRVPALKTYLALGFRPWYKNEVFAERWRAVFEANGLPKDAYFAYDEMESRKLPI